MHRSSLVAALTLVTISGIGQATAQPPTPPAPLTPPAAAITPDRAAIETYAALVQQAYALLRDGKAGDAASALAKTQESLRGWEYRHLQLLVTGGESPAAKFPGKVRIGPDGMKAGLSFSPSGSRLAMGCGDGKAYIYDLSTMKEINSWVVAENPGGTTDTPRPPSQATFVREVIFLGTTDKVVTLAGDADVRIWDTASHTVLTTLEPPGKLITDIAISPDGSTALLATPGAEVAAYDLPSGKKKLSFGKGMNFGLPLGFSPDGKHYASGGMARVELWDTATGAKAGELGQTSPYLMSFDFSRDGGLLAAGTRGSMAKCVRVFDVATSNMLWEFPTHGKGVNSVCFSPDGSRLISSGAGVGMKVWDSRTGVVLLEVEMNEPFGKATFSPDGRFIGWACRSGIYLLDSLGHVAR